MIKRGEIYLARLNPKRGKEVGKVRPVLVLQTDLLNVIGHPTIVVLPLSSILIDDAYPLRFRITKREKLEKDSDLLCDQIRAIDIQRVVSEPLATVTSAEMMAIEEQVKIVLGFV